jgi:adenylate cyclase
MNGNMGMSPRLLVEHLHIDRTFEYELKYDQTLIGRALGQNNLLLDDEKVSRRHARVRRAGSSFLIEDFNSVNGTFVNGKRINCTVLTDKDTITIGNCTLLFDDPSGPPAIRYKSQELGKTVLLRNPDEFAPTLMLKARTPASTALSAIGDGPLNTDAAVRELRKKAEALIHIYELSRVLGSVFSLQDILKKVCEILFRMTPADRFLVLLKDAGAGELLPFASEFRESAAAVPGRKIVISKTVLNHVLAERVSLLSVNAQGDNRLAHTRTLASQRIHSIMCAPLSNKSGVLGVIYVDGQDPARTFSADDLDLLNMLAVETSLAIDNARTHEQLLREALARAAYGRFMPHHVVDELLANPQALSLGGTNQQVTTLFSDLRGFTGMAENLSPEIVVQILNGYFSDLTPLIFQHNGMLDKYIGDGLMALFGVPYPTATAARDAVSAAVAMQRAMVKINRQLQAGGLPEIAMGIGINTGSVTVGYIGSEQRTDYTAIGDAVNQAARLEKHAEAGQILISQSTFEACGEGFQTRPRGDIRVKGKSEPVRVHEVIWTPAD